MYGHSRILKNGIMQVTGYRQDIDGLRALAVMPVVLNHAGIPGFPGGFVGVDIFFVISGFLITGILARELEEQRFSILYFYQRRARRILPALFVVLISCLIGGWFLLYPTSYEDLGKATIATLAFSSNIWFWYGTGDYFGQAAEMEPLLHTWSLAVEEQFYLFFPILLWIMSRWSRRWWIAVIALISAASFFLSVLITQSRPDMNFYLVPTRAWEFGVGALLAIGAVPAFKSQLAYGISGWAGLALIIGSIIFIDSQTPFPGLFALPPVLGAAMIIFAGSGAGSRANALLSWSPFVWIGLISYSLYLWHWPILVAARYWTASGHLPLFIAAICIIISIVLAFLSWRYIERPFRINRGRQSISGPGILGYSVVGAAVIGICAGILVINKGAVGQFSDDQIAIFTKAIQQNEMNVQCLNRREDPLACSIGVKQKTAGSKTTVVWGDSHAGAMLIGFNDWLEKQGIHGLAFAKTACPPLLGILRADLPSHHRCDEFNDRVISEIEKAPDIERVILVSRWALATEGTRASHEAGKEAILARTGATSTGTAENAQLVLEGLDRLVSRLQSRGIDVIIISSVPEIGRHVPGLVLRYGDRLASSGFLPTRADYDARNQRALQIVETVASDNGSTVIYPALVMCNTICKVDVEGVPLYRDGDHLSDFGARWLIDRIFTNITIRTD